MLGEKIASARRIWTPDSAQEQFNIARDAIYKISELTGTPWGLVLKKCYDDAVAYSVIEGFVYGVAATGGIVLAKRLYDKKKQKQK